MPSIATDRNFVRNSAGLALILLVVVFCIWPAMHAPLFTDDVHQLERSRSFTKWTEVFNVDVFGYFRPAKNALFMAVAPLSKNLPAWHVVGLLIYLGATLGVYRIATICIGPGRPALLATLLWTLNPSSVSTAVWFSCSNISLGIICAAGLFHFHELWAERPSFRRLLASALCLLLSLLCYESLIAIPAVLFIRDLQQRRLAFDRRSAVRYGVYTLVALGFLILRHQFSARAVGGDNFHPGLAPDTKAIHMSLSAPWFLWRHFLMWVFPFGKIEVLGTYAWLRSASPASLVFGWVFLLSLLATAAATWKRMPVAAFGVLFFVVASAPSGNFLPCFNGPINDAYVTIPSIGLALLVAKTCELLWLRFLKLRQNAESGGVAILVVLGVLLIYRLPVCGAYFRYWAGVWANPVELMLLTSDTRPFQLQPKGYASILLFSRGYIDQSEILAKEVLAEASWDPTARLTMARVARYHGDFKAAQGYYRYILDHPKGTMFLIESARIELAGILATDPAGREEAAQLCREVLKKHQSGQTPAVIDLLTHIYEDQGNTTKARETLKRGLALFPKDEGLQKLMENLNAQSPPTEAQGH